ncbi:cell wall protein [Nocardioides daphniae]|nr:cell wall protein [Nocardioides daphniae]QCC77423.1 cell wall protein [Nocardioides daphniae]
MPTLSPLRSPTRRLLAIALAISAAATTLIAYAVWRGASGPSGSPSPPRSDQTIPLLVEAPAARTPQQLRSLSRTDDPQAFVREVALALFGFDTTTVITRADHLAQLVEVADPTGESAPGLVSDLDNYLPTPQAWTQLAQYETRQWLAIDSITTPSKWSEALAQAGDELLPGTTALTVRGVRHREGVWEGEHVASDHEVAFTVFIVCAPAYPQCHLLRLSLLDRPLE